MTPTAVSAIGARRLRSAVHRLLRQAERPRRLTRRELGVEVVGTAGVLAVAAALPVLFAPTEPTSWGAAAALVLCHAIASRMRLYLGVGCAMPSQLVLIPMLFVVDPAMVPALVAAGLTLATAFDVVRGRRHPERLITGAADAWHAVGPSVVFALAGDVVPGIEALGTVALAVAAQCACDLAAATAREWLGRGTAPALQAQVIGLVYAIDVCLTPLGVLLAAAWLDAPAEALLVAAPLLALLGLFASDRQARIDDLARGAEELRAERARLQEAIRRTGDAFASGLDRPALAEVMLATAIDALDADAARTTLSRSHGPAVASDELDALLALAEDAARDADGLVVVDDAGGEALAQPLADAQDADGRPEVLTIARRRPFSEDERSLFGYLANQAAVAMENVALHDQLRRQATVDDLTGLANHRRLQAALELELGRARRTQQPLSIVMLDIDDFKAVNDTYGHQQGDLVLRRVADVVRTSCRATDEAARYGGEELAVVLRDTDRDGAHRLGEKLRRAVEAIELSAPNGDPLRVTVSVGVAAAVEDASRSDLIARADAALYAAKRSGKNRTVLADEPVAAVAVPPVSADAHGSPRRFARADAR